MGEGRGSAVVIPVAAMVVVVVVLLSGMAEAATTYTVGDNSGWTYGVNSWPAGKSFRAGDILVFNYGQSMHNVVSVNRAGYTGCSTPAGSPVYWSGNDKIKLAKGANYFICNFPGHCESGMKIYVYAA